MKDENSEIYYLQFYIDHKTGKMHSTTSGINSQKHIIQMKNVMIGI